MVVMQKACKAAIRPVLHPQEERREKQGRIGDYKETMEWNGMIHQNCVHRFIVECLMQIAQMVLSGKTIGSNRWTLSYSHFLSARDSLLFLIHTFYWRGTLSYSHFLSGRYRMVSNPNNLIHFNPRWKSLIISRGRANVNSRYPISQTVES